MYDAVNNRTAVVNALAKRTTFACDAASNRTTKLTGGVTTSYTYNNAGALTVANAGGTLTTYSWDDAGNNTVVNANGSLTTLAWDDQNRLQVAELPAGGRVTQTYDHEGRRRQREDANGTVKFVWDGKRLLAELDSGGNTLARYTSGVDEFGPTVSQRRGATSSFYLSDALGSVLRLAGANESVTDSYVLDAWGAQVAASGSTTNPHRYVGTLGYYTESALSLDYVRSRWLRPGTGSWLSVDPVEGEQRYGYAGGRATWEVDPSGEIAPLAWLGGALICILLGAGLSGCSRPSGPTPSRLPCVLPDRKICLKWYPHSNRACIDCCETIYDACLRGDFGACTSDDCGSWKDRGPAACAVWCIKAP